MEKTRFELRGEVARDEVTVLFRAFDRQMQREVVLKRLLPEISTSTDLRTRMIREARALAQVRSPFILSVFEVGEDEEGPFLSLEPARGDSLRERVERLGPLDIDKVVQHGIELTQALCAVHRGRIVHGGLDASQVFLDDSGEVRLTGFATARRNPDAPAPDTVIGQSTSLISATRDAKGPYAPEELLGAPVDARSDVFALGLVLVECLAGSLPYPSDAQGLNVDLELLRRLRPDVPEALDAVICKAIDPNPDERYASAADFGTALRAFAPGGSGVAPASDTSAPAPSTFWNSWKPFGAALAAASVLAGGLWFSGVLPADGSTNAIAGTRGVAPGTRGGARPVMRYAPGYENSHALVVGIDRYSDPAWPDLEQAEADAQAVYDYLIEEEHFDKENVVLLLGKQATTDAIKKVLLKTFGDDEIVKPNDRVLFFFAGHGQQQRAHAEGSEGDRIGYLVPYDATEDTYTCLMHDVIRRATEATPAKHVLMLLDCCFSGWAATRSAPGGARLRSATTESACQVITAGKPGEPVGDTLPGVATNSPFTHFLLEGLRGAAGAEGRPFITASELGAYVKDHVIESTDSVQNPVSRSMRGMGDFVFSPRALESAATDDE